MRRTISLLLIFTLCLSGAVFANAANETEEKVLSMILPEDFDPDAETVSRWDCLITIMKAIGANACVERFYATCVMTDHPVFYDLGRWEKDSGYILFAGMEGMANGIHTGDGYDFKFEPLRAVTTKECLAFMLRCLYGEENISYEATMSDAAKAELIFGNEAFANAPDSPVSASAFKLLLKRMLYKKQGIYWPAESYEFYENELQFNHDKEQRYIDLLEVALDGHSCSFCGEY